MERTYTLFGKRVRSPLLKLVAVVLSVSWSLITLPLHIAVWAVNGRGFLVKRGGRNYSYEPPMWAAWSSLAVFVLLLVLWL